MPSPLPGQSGFSEEQVERGDLNAVSLVLCDACLDGWGGECHTPGCALWMSAAPDVSLREKAVFLTTSPGGIASGTPSASGVEGAGLVTDAPPGESAASSPQGEPCEECDDTKIKKVPVDPAEQAAQGRPTITQAFRYIDCPSCVPVEGREPCESCESLSHLMLSLEGRMVRAEAECERLNAMMHSHEACCRKSARYKEAAVEAIKRASRIAQYSEDVVAQAACVEIVDLLRAALDPVEEGGMMKHHGPMHGERTRRHQALVDGNSREGEEAILTIYEVSRNRPDDPRLFVEVMIDGFTNALRLTPAEARELAEAAAEFADAYPVEDPS